MPDDAATPFAETATAPLPATPRISDPAATAADRTYATFMHLMLVFATLTVLPMIFGPLVMWLVKKHESAFIHDHGKEALNFNLSVLIYLVGRVVAGFITCGMTWYLTPVLWVGGMVFSIVAAVAANKGEYYRYPACIRIIA